MKDSNYWKQFAASGRIEDYLRYKALWQDTQAEDQVSDEGKARTGEAFENEGLSGTQKTERTGFEGIF